MAKATAGDKVCEECGATYRAKNARFCSMKCRSAIATGPCRFEGCPNAAFSRGWCSGHAAQYRQGKTLSPLLDRKRYPRPCIEEGCEETAVLRRRCTRHYRVLYHAEIGPCAFGGCVNNATTRKYQLCSGHYGQYRRGQPLTPLLNPQRRRGDRVGTGNISRGYRRVYRPTHPMAGSNGLVTEHRLVMAERIGRALRGDESVHHINGDKLDNRPENLELWASPSHHPGQRVDDLVADAVAILELYAPDRLAVAARR